MRTRQHRRRQRGAALILFAVVLVLGIAWYAVSAVGNVSMGAAERATKTRLALKSAKEALLGYVAQYAARMQGTGSDEPGQMPCPESVNAIGTTGEGQASSSCSNVNASVGRLPWRTLGVDQLRDGDGEPLWYVLSENFRSAPMNFGTPGRLMLDGTMTLAYDGQTANFTTGDVITGGGSGAQARIIGGTDTGATGTLVVDTIVGAFQDNETITAPGGGTAVVDGTLKGVVALIIAPGKPLNTLTEPGTPPGGCPRVNQLVPTRNSAPLSAANFLECGNVTGSYASSGVAPWSNDRVIAVTATEWADAIAPAIAERLQRQVVPALESWRSTESINTWGSRFLPHASSFTNPSSNDFCGDTVSNSGVTEGLVPTARAASSSCSWWNSWDLRRTRGGGTIQASSSCLANAAGMVCTVNYTGSPTVQVSLTAQNIAASFRARISSGDATAVRSNGNAITRRSFSHGLYSYAVSADASGLAYAIAEFDLPSGGSPATITIKQLPDAAIFADTRMQWFLDNNWGQHVYYAFSRAARLTPFGAVCNSPGDADCLTASDLPAANGNTDDKRLVLVLAGRPLQNNTQPSANLADYFELDNASAGDRTFEWAKVTSIFNDRLAMCPFRYHSTATPVCN